MKTSTSKNDTPNKFWASVEPYCAPFTDDDLKVGCTGAGMNFVVVRANRLSLRCS